MKNILIILILILTSCSDRDANPNEVNIRIKVKENQEVFLNGDITKIEEISKKIIAITSRDTTHKREDYVVNFDVDEDTKMGTIVNIKQQLREANIVLVEYEAN